MRAFQEFQTFLQSSSYILESHKSTQTSSSSDTFSPKFRMLSSFSASRSLTFISSSCRQLIISSFCRMMSALREESPFSSLEGFLVVSTISESFRIRSFAVSSSPNINYNTFSWSLSFVVSDLQGIHFLLSLTLLLTI